MFRLAVADIETGYLNINVSAIASHKYARNLSATLASFIYSSPHDFLQEMTRIPSSPERDECILYFSTLLHELRHYLDIMITPYGAWRVGHTFRTMMTLPQIMGAREPLVVPLTMAGDPFYFKQKTGLSDLNASNSFQIAKNWRSHKAAIDHDNRYFRSENGRPMRFGGEAMLEALAFSTQLDILNLLAGEGAYIRQRFPAAFNDLVFDNATHIDATYRWYMPYLHMIGKEANPGVARLVKTAIFASLCGIFHNGDDTRLCTNLNAPPSSADQINLTGQLPSEIFQSLIGALINRYEGECIDPGLTWQEAWATVTKLYENEKRINIWQAIGDDFNFQRSFFEKIKTEIESHDLDGVVGETLRWYEGHLALRSDILALFEEDPSLLVDPLRQLSLFDERLSVPIVLEYPRGTNEVLFGSEPIDTDVLQFPKSFTERFKFSGSMLRRLLQKFVSPTYYERVHYSSLLMRGVSQNNVSLRSAWKEFAEVQLPLFKSMIYGQDPLDISGRSNRIVDGLKQQFSQDIVYIKTKSEQAIVTSVDNYFDFYGIEHAECDLCSSGDRRMLKRNELVLIGSAAIGKAESNKSDDETILANLRRVMGERDWSDYRVCKHCFVLNFPEKAVERYFR